MLAHAELQMKYDFVFYVEPVFDLYASANDKAIYCDILLCGIKNCDNSFPNQESATWQNAKR